MKLLVPAFLVAALGCASNPGMVGEGIGTISGAVTGTVTGTNGSGFGSGTASGTNGGTGGTAPATVIFNWAFSSNQTCVEVGAQTVQITLEGNTIPFPCTAGTGTVDGITPEDVQYTVTAIAADGITIVASATGNIDSLFSGAEQTVSVTLDTGAQTGALSLGWSFGGLDCVQAGVTQVLIETGDGGLQWTFPCDAFGSGDAGLLAGALIDGLPLGETLFTLQGLGIDLSQSGEVGTVAWTGSLQASVSVSTSPMLATLAPVTPQPGSRAALQWTLEGLSCASAGEPLVLLALFGPDGGDAGFTLPCSDGGIDGTLLGGLLAGPYGFTLGTNLDAGESLPTVLSASGTFFVNGVSDLALLVELVAADAGVPGLLTLDYQLDGYGSCGDAGVGEVETQVFDSNGVPQGDLLSDCGDLPVTFQALAPGLYTVNAQGLLDDQPAYLSYGTDVTVGAGTTSAYLLTLLPTLP